MPDLRAADYHFARFAIERGLGALYVVAFVVAARQFPALSGERGLQPAPRILESTTFWEAPSLFHLAYSDRWLRIAAWIALFGLYAAVRTRAIAIGEFLSLPLFVGLVVALGERLTLEAAGLLWVVTFGVYAGFNFWALRTPITKRLATIIVTARK